MDEICRKRCRSLLIICMLLSNDEKSHENEIIHALLEKHFFNLHSYNCELEPVFF